MRFTLFKIIAMWFFLFVFSVLHAFSAIDEIKQGSSVWFVAINIIIPSLIVVSITIHGLYRKPVRYGWFWKIVPFSYAALCLWDFFLHLREIVMSINKLIVIAVIAILSIQFFAFYLSLKFGFSGKRLGTFGKLFIIITAFFAFFVFITIPSVVSIHMPGFDAYSRSDIKNAFTAAQAYFSDYPNGSVNHEILKANGFRASKGVTLSFDGSSQYSLSMNARHKNGKKTFQVDWQGNIKEDPPDTRLGNFKKSISRHLFVWKMLIGF